MKFWINITTEDGELLDRVLIQTERADTELPKGEQARRITDYITRRYDEIAE